MCRGLTRRREDRHARLQKQHAAERAMGGEGRLEVERTWQTRGGAQHAAQIPCLLCGHLPRIADPPARCGV